MDHENQTSISSVKASSPADVSSCFFPCLYTRFKLQILREVKGLKANILVQDMHLHLITVTFISFFFKLNYSVTFS
jgi:hypothetical protein